MWNSSSARTQFVTRIVFMLGNSIAHTWHDFCLQLSELRGLTRIVRVLPTRHFSLISSDWCIYRCRVLIDADAWPSVHWKHSIYLRSFLGVSAIHCLGNIARTDNQPMIAQANANHSSIHVQCKSHAKHMNHPDNVNHVMHKTRLFLGL